jgi:hypothetical protein
MDYNLDIPDIYAFDIEKTDKTNVDNKIVVNEIKNINYSLNLNKMFDNKNYKIFEIILPTEMIIVIKTNYKLEIVMLRGNSYIPVYNNFIYFCTMNFDVKLKFCIKINDEYINNGNNGNNKKLHDYMQLYTYEYYQHYCNIYPISSHWINYNCYDYYNYPYFLVLLQKTHFDFNVAFIITIIIDINQQIPEFIKLYSSDLEFTYKTYRYNNIVNLYLVSIRNILNNDLIKFNIISNKLNFDKIFKIFQNALSKIIYFIDKIHHKNVSVSILNNNIKVIGKITILYFVNNIFVKNNLIY